jgi:antitoxin component of MazEF toxin-antitoxin module
MVTSNKFITTIQQFDDSEEQFIELPDELCQELGWKEGTEITWEIQDDAILISEYKNPNNWYQAKEEAIKQYIDSIELT